MILKVTSKPNHSDFMFSGEAKGREMEVFLQLWLNGDNFPHSNLYSAGLCVCRQKGVESTQCFLLLLGRAPVKAMSPALAGCEQHLGRQLSQDIWPKGCATPYEAGLAIKAKRKGGKRWPFVIYNVCIPKKLCVMKPCFLGSGCLLPVDGGNKIFCLPSLPRAHLSFCFIKFIPLDKRSLFNLIFSSTLSC